MRRNLEGLPSYVCTMLYFVLQVICIYFAEYIESEGEDFFRVYFLVSPKTEIISKRNVLIEKYSSIRYTSATVLHS